MNLSITQTETSLKPTEEKTRAQKDKELRETCAAFEGMFLQMMMKTMRQASVESTLVKKSAGEKIFTEMLDQEYVNLAAKNGSSGLGGTLYEHLKSTLPEYREQGNYFPADAGFRAYEAEKALKAARNTGFAVDFIK